MMRSLWATPVAVWRGGVTTEALNQHVDTFIDGLGVGDSTRWIWGEKHYLRGGRNTLPLRDEQFTILYLKGGGRVTLLSPKPHIGRGMPGAFRHHLTGPKEWEFDTTGVVILPGFLVGEVIADCQASYRQGWGLAE